MGYTVAEDKNTPSVGVARRGADLANQYALGVNNAVKGLTDLLGPENPASEFLESNIQWYQSYLSATATKNQEEISRLFNEAEDKGVIGQLVAAGKAFGTAPADFIAGGMGSLSVFMAGGASARIAGAGAKGIAAVQSSLGAGIQVGIVKNEIYEGVKEELSDQGVTSAEAEKLAREAQSYGGKNLDQLIVAGGIGVADGLFGANRIVRRALTRSGLGASASRVSSVLATGITGGGIEFLQGGHEKFSSNMSKAREGGSDKIFRGVVTQGGLEGLVGGLMSGGMASVEARSKAKVSKAGVELSQEELSLKNKARSPLLEGELQDNTLEKKQQNQETKPTTSSVPQGEGENNSPSVPKNPVDKNRKTTLSQQKLAILGIENDKVGQYLASNYPELTKKAGNPTEFKGNLKVWRQSLERDISAGKYLNKSYSTGGFLREHGYEPSQEKVSQLLEEHRAKQLRVQTGWVRYLKEGGYSDEVSGLILNSITKEIAYKTDGQWEFRKLGGSSMSIPSEADPELAAEFARSFNGEKKPSQVLSEIGRDIARKTMAKEHLPTSVSMSSDQLTWIKFPSREKDPENFDANVLKLTEISKTVEDFGSCKWCTAHGRAEGYLSTGDFWVGADPTGRARCGIRLDRDQIAEIRGVLHSQSVEPGLCKQLSEHVSKENLGGGDRWVEDAKIKGKVAELAQGCTWDEIKASVGKNDDAEALDFISAYRGPSGEYDMLVGADNSAVHKILWNKLSDRPMSNVSLISRAGSISQARKWIDGEVLDTPRSEKFGGGRVIHSLFADNEGMAGKTPQIIKEWGLLTATRQNLTTADGDNIWHLQAGRRIGAISRTAVGGPPPATLMPFLNWEGIDRQSLYQPNVERLTPMHVLFETESPIREESALRKNASVEAVSVRQDSQREVVAAYLNQGGSKELLMDGNGTWKYPLIFSAAKGGLLKTLVSEGVVRSEDISATRNTTGDTPWHHSTLNDFRALASEGLIGPSVLGLKNNDGVTVAESISRKPGGFSILVKSGLLNRENAPTVRGTQTTLGHMVASLGEAESVLESGIYPPEMLLQQTGIDRDNFLHRWASGGLRVEDPSKLKELVGKSGLTPEDFLRPNAKQESAALLFADKPQALMFLAQAGLVDDRALATKGGVWKESILHRLPPHSQNVFHFFKDRGSLKRHHLLERDAHDSIPLHNFLRASAVAFPDTYEESSGEESKSHSSGLVGIQKVARQVGLLPSDFALQCGSSRKDGFDALREGRQQDTKNYDDPAVTLFKAGLVDSETLFNQRHSPQPLHDLNREGRSKISLELSKKADGRSPFEDCVGTVFNGEKNFRSLCDAGAVNNDSLNTPHEEGSEWANYTEFILNQAQESSEWNPHVINAINQGLIDRRGLMAEGRSKDGPVLLKLNNMIDDEALLCCLRKGVISPSDLSVGGHKEENPSVLARILKHRPSTLEVLIKEDFVEKGSLLETRIPYGQDDGNPARHLVEHNLVNGYVTAGQKGLLDKREATFGRSVHGGGPLNYAMENGLIHQVGSAKVLGDWMLNDVDSMRTVWRCAANTGQTTELIREMRNNGVTTDRLRQSFLAKGDDGKSMLSFLGSRRASDALTSLSEEGLVKRIDLLTEEGTTLIRSILNSYPENLPILAKNGMVRRGDLYSGDLETGGLCYGARNFVQRFLSSGKSGEERVLTESIAKSGLLSEDDKLMWTRDICSKRSGSEALRVSLEIGLVQNHHLATKGSKSENALDNLLKSAHSYPERRRDLSLLLEKDMVPQEYLARFERGVNGKFSAVLDATERISVTLGKFIYNKEEKPLAPLRKSSRIEPSRTRGVSLVE